MTNDFTEIREKIYDLEMKYEEIGMLIEIIKDFGEYSAEFADGAEKMVFLAAVLQEKSIAYKKMLAEFIPEFQQTFK